MSSYDLSPKAYMRMSSILDILANSSMGSLVELRGTKTTAVYLRQALVAAEYNNDEKYGKLCKMWSISYRVGDVIICKKKAEHLTTFRTFKLLTGVVESVTMLSQHCDAQALYFPNVKPTNGNETLLATMMDGYPDFQVTRFNDNEGLLISRRIEK